MLKTGAMEQTCDFTLTKMELVGSRRKEGKTANTIGKYLTDLDLVPVLGTLNFSQKHSHEK